MFRVTLTSYGESLVTGAQPVHIKGFMILTDASVDVESLTNDLSAYNIVLDEDTCGNIVTNNGVVTSGETFTELICNLFINDSSTNTYYARTILFYTQEDASAEKKIIAGYSQEDQFFLKTVAAVNLCLSFNFSSFFSGINLSAIRAGSPVSSANSDGLLHLDDPNVESDDSYSVYSKSQIDDNFITLSTDQVISGTKTFSTSTVFTNSFGIKFKSALYDPYAVIAASSSTNNAQIVSSNYWYLNDSTSRLIYTKLDASSFITYPVTDDDWELGDSTHRLKSICVDSLTVDKFYRSDIDPDSPIIMGPSNDDDNIELSIYPYLDDYCYIGTPDRKFYKMYAYDFYGHINTNYITPYNSDQNVTISSNQDLNILSDFTIVGTTLNSRLVTSNIEPRFTIRLRFSRDPREYNATGIFDYDTDKLTLISKLRTCFSLSEAEATSLVQRMYNNAINNVDSYEYLYFSGATKNPSDCPELVKFGNWFNTSVWRTYKNENKSDLHYTCILDAGDDPPFTSDIGSKDTPFNSGYFYNLHANSLNLSSLEASRISTNKLTVNSIDTESNISVNSKTTTIGNVNNSQVATSNIVPLCRLCLAFSADPRSFNAEGVFDYETDKSELITQLSAFTTQGQAEAAVQDMFNKAENKTVNDDREYTYIYTDMNLYDMEDLGVKYFYFANWIDESVWGGMENNGGLGILSMRDSITPDIGTELLPFKHLYVDNIHSDEIGTESNAVNHIYAEEFIGDLTGKASSADEATKATQDGSGNVITSKYCTLDTAQTISGSKTFINGLQFSSYTNESESTVKPRFRTWDNTSSPSLSGIDVTGNLNPSSGDTYSLGNSTYKWKNIYGITVEATTFNSTNSSATTYTATNEIKLLATSPVDRTKCYTTLLYPRGGESVSNGARYGAFEVSLRCLDSSGYSASAGDLIFESSFNANSTVASRSLFASQPDSYRNFDLGTTVSPWNTLYTKSVGSSSDPVANTYVKHLNIPRGNCTTDASTVAKTVTCSPAITASDLSDGLIISVYFSYTNTASNPTLNVDNTGALALRQRHGYAMSNTIATSWSAGEEVLLIYYKSGSTGYWCRLGLSSSAYPTSTASGTTNIIPSTNNTYNLGSTAYHWSDTYSTSVHTDRLYSLSIPASSSSGAYIIIGSSNNETALFPIASNYCFIGTETNKFYRGYFNNLYGTLHSLYGTGSGAIYFFKLVIKNNSSSAITVPRGSTLTNSSYFSSSLLQISSWEEKADDQSSSPGTQTFSGTYYTLAAFTVSANASSANVYVPCLRA